VHGTRAVVGCWARLKKWRPNHRAWRSLAESPWGEGTSSLVTGAPDRFSEFGYYGRIETFEGVLIVV
jgi:hypothetical protein